MEFAGSDKSLQAPPTRRSSGIGTGIDQTQGDFTGPGCYPQDVWLSVFPV